MGVSPNNTPKIPRCRTTHIVNNKKTNVKMTTVLITEGTLWVDNLPRLPTPIRAVLASTRSTDTGHPNDNLTSENKRMITCPPMEL